MPQRGSRGGRFVHFADRLLLAQLHLLGRKRVTAGWVRWSTPPSDDIVRGCWCPSRGVAIRALAAIYFLQLYSINVQDELILIRG
jgi:hypothetical protein